jgi:transcriptional regulator with XRE-family HTH domain
VISNRVDSNSRTRCTAPHALKEQAMSTLDGRVPLRADLLKQLRRARGWSQDALAEYCLDQHLCVSLASIKRAEAGLSVLYRTARHLAQALGTAPSELLVPPSASSATTRKPIDIDVEVPIVSFNLDPALSATAWRVLREADAVRAMSSDRRQLTVVFGLPCPRATDLARSYYCAMQLAPLLHPGSQPIHIRRRLWRGVGASQRLTELLATEEQDIS